MGSVTGECTRWLNHRQVCPCGQRWPRPTPGQASSRPRLVSPKRRSRPTWRRPAFTANSSTNNPALQNGAATVFNHLGVLHRWAGRTSEALLCQGRARELQESLVHHYPSTADYKANLAVTYYYLAGLKAFLRNHTDFQALYLLARGFQ